MVPPLGGLLDASIESALDCSADDGDITGHIDLHIAYLYRYVSELQKRTFAVSLKYENRQYHFDVLSGMSTGTVPSNEHQCKIREALRQKTFEFRECSASCEDKTLFTEKGRVRQPSRFASRPPGWARVYPRHIAKNRD